MSFRDVVPLEEQYPAEAFAYWRAVPEDDQAERMRALSDEAQALMKARPSAWWKDEASLRTVTTNLRLVALYRALTGPRAPKKALAQVLYARRENERGFMQSCVVAECLAPGEDDPPTEEAYAWGQHDRSVRRALGMLDHTCPCGGRHEQARSVS